MENIIEDEIAIQSIFKYRIYLKKIEENAEEIGRSVSYIPNYKYLPTMWFPEDIENNKNEYDIIVEANKRFNKFYNLKK